MAKRNQHAKLTLNATDDARHKRGYQLDTIIRLLSALSSAEAQMMAELRAGQHYLNAPLLRSDIVEELLLRHLEHLAKGEPTARITIEATEYLAWLRRALS